MSILDFPRVNFRGIFATNPCTANNDDVIPSVVTRDTNSLGAGVAPMTDDEARTYLRGEVKMRDFGAPGSDEKALTRAGWNPNGDHVTSFSNTTVRSVVNSDGAVIDSPNEDPCVGVTFEIIGSYNQSRGMASSAVIVDLDPTGLVNSQIFVGGIRFSFKDGAGQTEQVEIFHDTRAYQYWLYFNSTVSTEPYKGEQNFVGIGCIWQFVIPAAALQPSLGRISALKSAVLQDLLAQACAGGGLAVRFRSYEVEPGYTDEYVVAQMARGNNIANPAYGYLVGAMGVWREGEPQGEPAGRKLEASYLDVSPTQKGTGPASSGPRPDMWWAVDRTGSNPQRVAGCPYPWMGPPALIGNIVANVRQSPPIISLDIVNAFPKLGYRNPNGPVTMQPPEGFDRPGRMAYVGDVELAVVAPNGVVSTIGAVDYGFDNFSRYEDLGGVVDLKYDASLYDTIQNGQLILRGSSGGALNAGVTLLNEPKYRVVTDQRSNYLTLDQGDFTLNVKVYERGGPPTTPVKIYLYEYRNIIQVQDRSSCTTAGSPDSQYRPNQTVTVRTETVEPDNPAFVSCPGTDKNGQPSRLLFPASVTLPQGYADWFPITVSPNRAAGGGAAVIGLQPEQNYIYGMMPGGNVGPAGVPVWSTTCYSSFRVYEDESSQFSALYQKEGGLQWTDVYQNALRYYYLLFPSMSKYIPLNSQSAIHDTWGEQIKQRLHTPDNPQFYSTLNMPITRAMSPARVKLLLDFIDQQSPGRDA